MHQEGPWDKLETLNKGNFIYFANLIAIDVKYSATLSIRLPWDSDETQFPQWPVTNQTKAWLYIKANIWKAICRNNIKKWDYVSVCTWLTSIFSLYCIKMTGPNKSNLTHLDHGTVLIFLSHWGLKQKHWANKGQIWNFKEVTHDRTNN